MWYIVVFQPSKCRNNVPHLHPNSTMFMPLDRLQLTIYAFSGKFNVCSKRVLLLWINICRDFRLQTQIFTQKYRSWLRFYSEYLSKNLAGGVSVLDCQFVCHVTYKTVHPYVAQLFVNMPWESSPKNGRFKTKSIFKRAFHWQLKHTAFSKRFDNTWQDIWMQMRISGEYSDNSHSNWETHMGDMADRILWMISRCICSQFLPRTDQHGVGRTQRICTTQSDRHPHYL